MYREDIDGIEGLDYAHILITSCECHLLLKWLAPTGYGKVRRKGKTMAAHRVAYIAFYGTNPKAWLRHTCDVSSCVNPQHLIPGTPKENAADRVERNRSAPTSEEFKLARKGKPLTDKQRAAIIERNKRTAGPRPRTSVALATTWAVTLGIPFSKWPKDE
jgi:hypothetical protein